MQALMPEGNFGNCKDAMLRLIDTGRRAVLQAPDSRVQKLAPEEN